MPIANYVPIMNGTSTFLSAFLYLISDRVGKRNGKYDRKRDLYITERFKAANIVIMWEKFVSKSVVLVFLQELWA